MANYNVFKSVDSVLDVLLDNQALYSPQVQDVISVYNKNKCNANNQSGNEQNQSEKKHYLIVFEGLDGSGKSTIMKVVNKRINCKMFSTPPESLKTFRGYFDDKDPALRRAFYSIGNYIAAEEIKEILKERTVLMDRFWHSTCAFALANDAGDVEHLPPEDSDLYKWPEDLIKPDAVIYLSTPEDMRIERLSRRKSYSAEEDRLKNDHRFRDALVTSYYRMRDPCVIKVNSIKSPKKTAEFVIKTLIDKGIPLESITK